MADNNYYIYDSHSRNIAGYPVPNGTAVLLTFNSLQRLNKFIIILAHHLNADTFELTPAQMTCNVLHDKMIKGFNEQGHIVSVATFEGNTNNAISILPNKIDLLQPLSENNNEQLSMKFQRGNVKHNVYENNTLNVRECHKEDFKKQQCREYMKNYMAKRRHDKK